jgi:hypothetical protein
LPLVPRSSVIIEENIVDKTTEVEVKKEPNKLPVPRFAPIEGELVVIETTVPVPIMVMRRKFTENIKFIVDYDNSRHKGKVFITYITNMGVECELRFGSVESKLELVKEYLHVTSMVDLPQLEDVVINLLLAATGKPYHLDFNPLDFILENEEILQVWMRNCCMVPTYALHSYPPTEDQVKNYEEIPGDDLSGINFVHLASHILFPMLISDVPEEHWCWNKTFFKEYCFGGHNLFYYTQSENNPFFMALLVISEPEAVGDLGIAAATILQENHTYLKGLEHVPSA